MVNLIGDHFLQVQVGQIKSCAVGHNRRPSGHCSPTRWMHTKKVRLSKYLLSEVLWSHSWELIYCIKLTAGAPRWDDDSHPFLWLLSHKRIGVNTGIKSSFNLEKIMIGVVTINQSSSFLAIRLVKPKVSNTILRELAGISIAAIIGDNVPWVAK